MRTKEDNKVTNHILQGPTIPKWAFHSLSHEHALPSDLVSLTFLLPDVISDEAIGVNWFLGLNLNRALPN